jgi:hypothetical protein
VVQYAKQVGLGVFVFNDCLDDVTIGQGVDVRDDLDSHRSGLLKWQVKAGIRVGTVGITAPARPVRSLLRPSVGWSVLVRGPHAPRNPAPTDA